MLDRNDLDNYITGHYGNDQELGEESDGDEPITPEMAIRSCMFDLMVRRADWKDKPDPNGVVPHIGKVLDALGEAMGDLAKYRKLQEALATLKASAD